MQRDCSHGGVSLRVSVVGTFSLVACVCLRVVSPQSSTLSAPVLYQLLLLVGLLEQTRLYCYYNQDKSKLVSVLLKDHFSRHWCYEPRAFLGIGHLVPFWYSRIYISSASEIPANEFIIDLRWSTPTKHLPWSRVHLDRNSFELFYCDTHSPRWSTTKRNRSFLARRLSTCLIFRKLHLSRLGVSIKVGAYK